MPVVQIGTATAGKFCGGSMLQPGIQQGGQTVIDPDLRNWILYLMMFKFTDKNGNTVSASGLAPDISANYADLTEMAYQMCIRDRVYSKIQSIGHRGDGDLRHPGQYHHGPGTFGVG